MATTQLPSTLRSWTVYMDGVGYAGRVKEGTPPKVSLKTNEYKGGGMVGTVDISSGAVEKMEWDVTLEEYDPTVMALLAQEDIGVTFRGSAGSDGTAIIIETRGLVRENDMGNWGSDEATLKISGTATYYKLTIGGDEIIEVDIENMVMIVDGEDLLEDTRSALGL